MPVLGFWLSLQPCRLSLYESAPEQLKTMNSNGFKEKGTPLQEVVATVPEKKVKLKIEKNRIRRGLYLAGGILSLALAILGIAVPGLPVTPLALLSAFLFAKSSERLYNWLLSNRILGPRIRNYQRRKGVTRKGKLGIMLFMTVMALFSSFVVIQIIPIRIVILSMGVIGMVVVWFFVPTALDDPAKVENEDETK